MNKLSWVALGCSAFLAGCMAPPPSEKVSDQVLPSWNQSSEQRIEHDGQNAMVKLESGLWVDLMPRIGDEQEPPKLKGSLVLSSVDEIPAGVEIENLLLAIDGETWQLNDYEVEAVSPSTWKIRIDAQIDAINVSSADVAVQLSGERWLVERNVKVDKVY